MFQLLAKKYPSTPPSLTVKQLTTKQLNMIFDIIILALLCAAFLATPFFSKRMANTVKIVRIFCAAAITAIGGSVLRSDFGIGFGYALLIEIVFLLSLFALTQTIENRVVKK